MSNNKSMYFEYDVNSVRERCFKARQLAKLTPDEAAKAMGYKNTSIISKMEKRNSKNGLNFKFIARASLAYGVSIDFLLGISDYPERDPHSVEQLAVYHSVRQFTTHFTNQLMEKILLSANEHTLKGHLTMICDAADGVVKALEKVRALNPSFDEEMQAGSILVKNTTQLADRIAYSKARINKTEKEKLILKQFHSAKEDCEQLLLNGVSLETF